MRNLVRYSVHTFVLCSAFFSGYAQAANGVDPSDASLKADDSSSMMLERNDDTTTLSRGQLSARGYEVAELTGIWKIYNQLRKEQEAAKGSPATAKSIEELQRNMRIIYLHDKLNQYFQTANLEIDSTIAKLNSGMSSLGDRKATLADERARILRRNTFINLISGGLTKIGGYSVALTPASLIPTNVLEIFDGGVQTSLSASTIKQQRDEKRFSKTTPEMLLAFINGNSQTSPQYPPSVWAYLNTKANTTDKVSRRVTLIDRWRASGRMTPGGSTARKRPVSTAGATSKVVSFDDLDDTVTMLADIRSVLAGAQVSLMELSETLKSVYDDDPVI
ncbi:hypothetical protein BH10CYA1_BH10CYA1_08810 [soil metagenome]